MSTDPEIAPHNWIEETRNSDGTVTITEAEISRRMCNAANAIGAARREGWDACKAEIERLRAALRDARDFVQEELTVRIDSHTLGADISTLDETDCGCVGEAMDCLARIDAALASAGA